MRKCVVIDMRKCVVIHYIFGSTYSFFLLFGCSNNSSSARQQLLFFRASTNNTLATSQTCPRRRSDRPRRSLNFRLARFKNFKKDVLTADNWPLV